MIQSLRLQSYKGFRDTTIKFSNITCIIGENGTGKTTIIKAIQDFLLYNTVINPNNCKVGISDKNTTILSLAFQNGNKLSKNIQSHNLENQNRNFLPKCITHIQPIGINHSFPLTNNSEYEKLIKNHNIEDIAWRNILSHCDFTLRNAAESTTTRNDTRIFEKNHIESISENFTRTFNNMLGRSIGREYRFEVFFDNSGNTLIAQLQISYRESDRESGKFSPWADLNNESEGFRILIALCSYFFNDQDKSEKIFVMDEPFTHIHPKAQKQVSRMLQSLSQRFQIIYTTHCPHLLPERDKVTCTFTETAGDLSTRKYKEEESPFSHFYELSPLALEYIEEKESEDSTINVIVEGIPDSDKKIYDKFFEMEKISDITNVISVGSSSNMNTYAMGFGLMKDTPSLFVLDPGEKLRNKKNLEQTIDKNDNLYLLEIPYEKNNHVKKGIENLMPNHIIQKAFQEKIGRIEKITRETYGETPVEEYQTNNKKELAEFFVDKATHEDYQFFKPVIKKINEIRKEFGV